MKIARRLILLASVAVIAFSVIGTNNLPQILVEPEVPKNYFNGLPGVNNQILVVKIDDTNAAHPQIGVEEADVV